MGLGTEILTLPERRGVSVEGVEPGLLEGWVRFSAEILYCGPWEFSSMIIPLIFRVSEETESGSGSPGGVLYPFVQVPLYKGKLPTAEQEVSWASPLSPS